MLHSLRFHFELSQSGALPFAIAKRTVRNIHKTAMNVHFLQIGITGEAGETPFDIL